MSSGEPIRLGISLLASDTWLSPLLPRTSGIDYLNTAWGEVTQSPRHRRPVWACALSRRVHIQERINTPRRVRAIAAPFGCASSRRSFSEEASRSQPGQSRPVRRVALAGCAAPVNQDIPPRQAHRPHMDMSRAQASCAARKLKPAPPPLSIADALPHHKTGCPLLVYQHQDRDHQVEDNLTSAWPAIHKRISSNKAPGT